MLILFNLSILEKKNEQENCVAFVVIAVFVFNGSLCRCETMLRCSHDAHYTIETN